MKRLVSAMLLAAIPFLAGCRGGFVVESDPPGAEVLWSPTGFDDWRPWPPRAWSEGPSQPAVTPWSGRSSYNDAVWVTVRREGYHVPLPRVAQLYPGRTERLRFELVETPEAEALRLRAEGFVPYKGEWVRPEELGLVEFEGAWLPADEAFRLSQMAKGLVEYKGQWMERAERDERYAADQRALGLVFFKERWVKPEARATEEALDREVLEIAATDPQELDPPKLIGTFNQPAALVQLLNATGDGVRWILSGPTTREMSLEAYESFGLQTGERLILEPGTYRIVAIPLPPQAPVEAVAAGIASHEAAPPAFIEQPLAVGIQYQFSYDGGIDVDIGQFEDYRVRDLELPPDLPVIEVPEVELPQPQRPQRGPGGGPPVGGAGGRRPGGATGGGQGGGAAR